uniref:Dynein light chain Tctex-type 1 n=1 Tax=Romanomermis culicivorax TaxID=13658 RepID=A0A915IRM4_ROMCU
MPEVDLEIHNVVGTKSYSHSQVPEWTQSITDQILGHLTAKMGSQYKYIVHCIIMQKTGAGLHMAVSCFWDHSTDSGCSVKYDNNKSMYCVVNVFACAI